MGQEVVVVVAHGRGSALAVGPDLCDDAGNGLLSASVAERARGLAGCLGWLHAGLLLLLFLLLLPLKSQLLLLCLSLLLGLSLCLGLGESSLLVHAGPDADLWRLLDRRGVDKVVLGVVVEGEVAGLLEVHAAHVDIRVHGHAGVPHAGVHHGGVAHHGHLVDARGREAEARVVDGVEASDRSRGQASLLLEALILVAGLRGRLQVVVDVGAGRAGDGGRCGGLALQVCGRGRGQLGEVKELLLGVDALAVLVI